MIEKILKAYEEHRRGHSELDEVVTPMATIDTLVKHIRKLETENADLKRELKAIMERS